MGIIKRSLREQRDSLSNPTKWLILAFGGGTDTATGIRVNEVVAIRNLTIMACIKVIAETFAQLPAPIYRRQADGSRVRVMDHPLWPIFNRNPNERMTAFTFKETLMAHLLTWGNAYAYIGRNNAGNVTNLYPLLPDRTRPQLSSNGELVYITRLKHDPNSVAVDDNKQLILPASDVLHVPGLGFDGLKGYSVIAQAREAIGLGLAMEEYAARFFGNGSIPGFVLQTDRNLSPEQRKMMETTWQEGHQGLTNAQRVAILEAGLKVQPIGIPPEDAQFLESRKFSRNELASIYRIPPHMIGDIERATSWGTGIEQQAIGFVVYTMMPWLTRWEQSINMRLLRLFEQDHVFIEFLVDGLLRGDTQTRNAAYNLAFGKWMTGNTIAARENLPSLGPGGDKLYAPPGALPLDENGDPQAPATTNDTLGTPTDPQIGGPTSAGIDLPETRRRIARAQVPMFVDVAERILRRERADLVREAERSKLTDEKLDLFYEDHRSFVERAALPALESYAESIRLSVESELGRLIPSPGAFVRSYAEGFARRHVSASRKLIADRTPPALERAFGTSTRRAEHIADQETLRALGAFSKALYREAMVAELRWVIGDQREECAKMALAPIPLIAKFDHPPLADDCRCVLLAAAIHRADPMRLALSEMAPPVTVNVTTPPVTMTIAEGAIRADFKMPERQVVIRQST